MLEFGEELSEDEVNEMINEADFNEDGKVDFEEFLCIMYEECGDESDGEPMDGGRD
jgi:Ca2+-binding EF-hand superfamily protein